MGVNNLVQYLSSFNFSESHDWGVALCLWCARVQGWLHGTQTDCAHAPSCISLFCPPTPTVVMIRRLKYQNKLWTNYINLGTGRKAFNIYGNLASLHLLANLSYLDSLLLLANLSWDINIELLFYLKCTRPSTPTINPHIKRSTESFLVISPPSRLFLLWTWYCDWQLSEIRCIAATDLVRLSVTHVGTYFYIPMRRWERQDLQRYLRHK